MSKIKIILVILVGLGIIAWVCAVSFNTLVSVIDKGKTPQQLAIEDKLSDARQKVWNNQQDPNAKVAFGKLLREHEDYHWAIKAFDQAIALDPKNVNAFIERGITYLSIGKLDNAEADYRTALKIESDNSDAYGWYAVLESTRAKFSQESHTPRTSLEHLDKAIALEKKCRQFNKNKLRWRTNLGETETTAAELAQALGHPQSEVRSRYASACMHIEEGLRVGPIGEWDEKTPIDARPLAPEVAIRNYKLLRETYNFLSEKEKARVAEEKLKALEAMQRSKK